MAALVANVWTIFYIVLLVGWQLAVFLQRGTWPALPLTAVFTGPGDTIYSTASIGRVETTSSLTTTADTLLSVPAIVALLLAAVLLTGFYVWLRHTEKRYSKKVFRRGLAN
jgi:hypothetical protein